jgi:cytochrome c5
MNKYGWEWKSEEAAEAYAQILAYVRDGGGFDGPKGIARLLSLADKLVHCEGRIPDSFLVSVDLGIIYSSACLFEGEDADRCEEFLAKAAEAWGIASSYLENGQPKATAGLDSNAAHLSYMRHYRLIPCEIGFARYLRSDRKELSHLADIKAQWEQAAKEDPDHKVLKVIGKHIREDLMSGHIKPDLAHEERTSGSPVQVVSNSSPQVVTPAPAISTRSHPNPALQIPVEAAPAPVAPSPRSEDSIELPIAQKSTRSDIHPSGKISSASVESGAAHDGSREVAPAPSTARSRVESVTDVEPTILDAAPAPVAPSLRSGDSIESPRAQKSTPSDVYPSGKISSASAEGGAAHDGSREAVPAPSTARSRVESVTDVEPTILDAAPAPVTPSQLSPSSRRSIRSLITAILASLTVIAGAGYFAIDGFWRMSTRQNAPSPSQTAAPSTVASLPDTTNIPETSTLREAPAKNNPLPEANPQTSPDVPAVPSASPEPTPTKSGRAVYASSCRSCHATGVSGSPRLDDVEAWSPRLDRSRASLYASVVEGKGAMPARGGDRLLRDEEIRRAVDFMVAEARTAAKAARAAVPIAPAAPTASTQPVLSAPARPAPVAPAEAHADWLPAMRGELERCRQGNFFGRVACTEKVRWKYCAPSRWNMVAECAA